MFSSNNTKGLNSTIILLLLSAGISTVVYGLLQISFEALPWDNRGDLVVYILYLCVIFFGVGFVSRFLKNIYFTGLIFIFGLSLITNKVWSLLVVIWIVVCSIIVGDFFARKIKLKVSVTDAFLIGSGFLGTFVGLLAHFRVNYVALYSLFLALICLSGRKTISEYFNKIIDWKKSYTPALSLTETFFQVFTCTVVVLYFTVSLMPELGYDSLAMHLFIPSELLLNHKWNFDVGKYVWAVMPMLGNWIFSPVYMFGGETSARILNLFFILVICHILGRIGKWITDTDNSKYLIYSLFLSTPLTFGIGSTTFVDAVWTAFLIAGIFLLVREDYKNPNKLILSSLFIAFAVASKFLAVLGIPLAAAIIVIKRQTFLKKEHVGIILKSLALFTSIGSIPYVTSWVLTGNPVFPFLNGVFRSPLWKLENFSDERWSKGPSIDFLYSLTFESGKYLEASPGAAGFQWLMFAPLCIGVIILFFRKKILIVLAAAIGFMVLLFQSTIYMRYAFPSFALLCVVVAIPITDIEHFSKPLRFLSLLVLAVTLGLNLMFLTSPFYTYRDFPLDSILSEENKYKFLLTRKPIRIMIDTVNTLNTNQSPVVIISEPVGTGLKSDAIYTDWYNEKWYQSLLQTDGEEQMRQLFSDYKVEYIIMDETFKLPEKQVELIKKVTDKVERISSVELRKVKRNNLFNRELLNNTNLKSRDYWQIPIDVIYQETNGITIVNEKAPVIQRVSVKPGTTYLAQVSSKCFSDTDARGRVQINWLANDGKFIKPDIKVFDCSNDWNINTMEVTSPDNAEYADFYLSSHDELKIQFNGASFKE